MNRIFRAILAVFLYRRDHVFGGQHHPVKLARPAAGYHGPEALHALRRDQADSGRLKQPITIKLYYTKTARMKAPDQIRYFNNYYEYVRALLEEYVSRPRAWSSWR